MGLPCCLPFYLGGLGGYHVANEFQAQKMDRGNEEETAEEPRRPRLHPCWTLCCCCFLCNDKGVEYALWPCALCERSD